MKKVYIRTFGCQMNVRDSEIILGMLQEKGYRQAGRLEDADAILFNTCSVRRHAEERAISNMGALLKNKKQRSKVYGIIGCTAQALKKDLFRRLPDLDIVCGTGQIHRLPELIRDAQKSRILACGSINKDIPEMQFHYGQERKAAFVSIIRGCNNFCSYCIVPYVRGKERSRKVEDIAREVEDLTKRGTEEITLLGQNVNSYKGDVSAKKCDFVQLLKFMNGIKGVKRIKFMTSHPKDATIELFKAIRDFDKVVKQLHLPLQSGSDRILKLMNRGYTSRKYTGLVRKLRALVPGCKISTDIIVGFPGETEADFRKSYKIMNGIKFNAAYIFKYSPRLPAKSAFMEDSVPQKTKEKRHKILLDLQKRLAKKISIVTILSFVFSLSSGHLFAQGSGLRNVEVLMLKGAYSQAARECERFLAGRHRAAIESKAQYLLGICLLKETSGYAGSYFSVQVGCFGNKTNAEKLRVKLINKGYQAYILQLPGDKLYRVRVGKLSSRSDAGSLERRLKAAGYSTKVCP